MDPAIEAMAKQLAEVKSMLAQTIGKDPVSTTEVLGEVLGSKSAKTANNDPRDADVPIQSPSKEFVNTQTTQDIVAGCDHFEVHSMIGIVPG